MLTPDFIARSKSKLLAEQARLQTELAGLPGHTEMGEDYEENIQESEIDDVSRDLGAKIKNDLEKINKALLKIEAGTYGTDDEGNEIPEERLEALPWAESSI